MIKLIRNRLASNKVLYDVNGNEIRWDYFVDLVRMNDRGFALAHKMNQSHIEWQRKKMKVNLAVQTLSESTATAMTLLWKNGVQEFAGSEHTIKFIRTFNTLFDIFNTKHDQNENPFKRALNNGNAAEIFDFFHRTILYIRGLKVLNNKNGKLVRVCNSTINTSSTVSSST